MSYSPISAVIFPGFALRGEQSLAILVGYERVLPSGVNAPESLLVAYSYKDFPTCGEMVERAYVHGGTAAT